MADYDDSMSTAAAAFGELPPAPTNAQIEEEDRRAEEEGEEEEQRPIDENVEGEQDDRDAEEESEASDEQDEEPETAIAPPVSWDAEGKELFAELPPVLQQKLVARESQRDGFVNAKAVEAQQSRDAADAAHAQNIQLHRQYAEQLNTYAQALEVPEPDYSLIATDPMAFAQQMAAYKQSTAQRDYLAQQSAEAIRQAEYITQQHSRQQQAADDAALTEAIPEWSDPAKRTEVLSGVVETARALGWPDELIRQARPVDILGVKKAMEWKSDAEKWRNLQKAKMEPVRAAKTLPKVSKPGAAQPKGSARVQGLQDSMTRLRQTGDVKDAAAAFRNLR